MNGEAGAVVGVCRHCGCSAEYACLDLEDPYALPCVWADASMTLCSACAERGGPPPDLPATRDEWLSAVADAWAFFEASEFDGEPHRALRDDHFDAYLKHDDVLIRAASLGIPVERPEGASVEGMNDAT
jgi:hypothetical protein